MRRKDPVSSSDSICACTHMKLFHTQSYGGKWFSGGVVTFFVVLVVFNNLALKFWSMIKLCKYT